jgi:DNA-binding MarR family transcriptional regulator
MLRRHCPIFSFALIEDKLRMETIVSSTLTMMPTGLHGPVKTVANRRGSTKCQEEVKQFNWEITSINVHLGELRQCHAKVLGITEPQWTILMALADMDKEQGVSVKVVSKKMHVVPLFVTTQSKLLEKKGFLRRKHSTNDARVVQMSLTDKSYEHFASLSTRQAALDDFLFEEFDHGEFTEFMSRLTALRKRLELARMKVALDF